jgi:hypothetical protein
MQRDALDQDHLDKIHRGRAEMPRRTTPSAPTQPPPAEEELIKGKGGFYGKIEKKFEPKINLIEKEEPGAVQSQDSSLPGVSIGYKGEFISPRANKSIQEKLPDKFLVKRESVHIKTYVRGPKAELDVGVKAEIAEPKTENEEKPRISAGNLSIGGKIGATAVAGGLEFQLCHGVLCYTINLELSASVTLGAELKVGEKQSVAAKFPLVKGSFTVSDSPNAWKVVQGSRPDAGTSGLWYK